MNIWWNVKAILIGYENSSAQGVSPTNILHPEFPRVVLHINSEYKRYVWPTSCTLQPINTSSTL